MIKQRHLGPSKDEFYASERKTTKVFHTSSFALKGYLNLQTIDIHNLDMYAVPAFAPRTIRHAST